jgi:hypothetical protein
VQAAFEVAEQDRDGFDALLVGLILEALLLYLVHRHATLTLRLGGEIQVFELSIGECQKVLEFIGHGGRSLIVIDNCRARNGFGPPRYR